MAAKKKPAAKKAPAKAKTVEAPEPEAPAAEQEVPAVETAAATEEPEAPKPEAPAAEPKTDVGKVELADKYTGFYDHETGFKIVRDQQKPLGEKVGRATRTAIVSGRLLVIGEK